MKHLLFVFAFFCVALVNAQNGMIAGVVKNANTQTPLEKVKVIVEELNISTLTNSKGEFKFEKLAIDKKYTVTFRALGYKKKSIEADLNVNEIFRVIVNLEGNGSELSAVKNKENMDSEIIEISDAELEEESIDEEVSGILTSSKDVLTSAIAYTFSSGRFRRRGDDSNKQGLFFNGLPMNNMETGRAYWYLWGGLNDVTRNQIVSDQMSPSEFGFGGFAQTVNVDISALTQRPQTKIVYSNSNKSYTHRSMVTHSTGLMDNGWAFTVSGSKRWGESGYSEGTFYDAYGYFLSAYKKLNEQHALELTYFGAPSERGKSGASTQEMYDLADDNYYNPYWGYQNGEVRNSRVQRTHIPIANLKHYWEINTKTKLTTTLAYIKGESGYTALNWHNSADPRPDYYRYLPSYQKDQNAYNQVADLLKNNKALRQINWHDLYRINSESKDGRAKYIVEERRRDAEQYIANLNFKHELNDNLTINVGGYYNNFIGHHFNVVDDLLGADYFVDIDQFAERDFGTGDPKHAQSDLIYFEANGEPRKVKEGDTFNNNYKAHIVKSNVFGQVVANYAHWDYFAALALTHTSMWREGLYKKGIFPDNSYGDSDKLNFIDYAAKAGVTYKLDGKNYFSFNAGFMTLAPSFRNTFISPRTRHTSVDDVIKSNNSKADIRKLDEFSSEKVLNTELRYNYLTSKFKAKVNLYYNKYMDGVETRSFYHDGNKTFVNSILFNVDKTHMGAEIALEAEVIPSLTAFAVACVGKYTYDNRPDFIIVKDNVDEVQQPKSIFMKNYRVTGAPQSAYTAGLKYRTSNYMWLGINANYFADNYLNMNYDRRDADLIDAYKLKPDVDASVIYDQEKLDNAFTLDLNIGKSWRIDYKYFINLNISVNNVLDNKDFITGGYEQSRWRNDESTTDAVLSFKPKYYYSYGRNYFVNLSFRF